MTDEELLTYYDEIAEVVDDEILDEADELFGIDDEEEPSDEYFIWVAQKYLDSSLEAADQAVESTFKIVTDVSTLTWD